MRIIIVGGGISGLTLYLYLQKVLQESSPKPTGISIHIYEKYTDRATTSASPDALIIGGFLAIAPNGLEVIRGLDRTLFDSICNAGHPITSFTFSSRYGHKLGQMPCTSYSDPPQATIVIARQTLWDCIRAHVPDDAITHAAISSIIIPSPSDVTGKPTLHFSDASIPPEQADLVIGTDGVHSIVRKAFPSSTVTDHSPKYVGLVGIGGLLPPSPPPSPPSPSSPSPSRPHPTKPKLDDSTMTLTFGPNGFFGYGAISPTLPPNSTRTDPSIGWWSTYSSPHPPNSKSPINASEVAASLRTRHKDWTDPVIQRVINAAKPETVYPTWVVPLESLQTWYLSGGGGDKEGGGKEDDGDSEKEWGVVLVGDAAHAMQPSAGQGVSMALEDVEVLSILLTSYLNPASPSPLLSPNPASKSPPPSPSFTLSTILDQYHTLRRPRVTKVAKMASRNGDKKRDLGVFAEWTMYGAIWAMGHLMPLLGGDRWGEWLFCKPGKCRTPGEEARDWVEGSRGRRGSR
ncbi:uncharacterized protein KY384_007217 [Bacidia gigantensis]|uniref:uncharacterized protein n=1 Tax=Bacidia gigantensis TaxID=2732470 RepID=UPI001D04B585|nr:uncharacterized protein KY384_007217 [Bacidia gigantensis]KAG8528300.1 hypothetical protein KY384_007217 [Bacidia gigantensis]